MAITNRGLLALSLLLGTTTAIAADGAIEINAACVDSGCFSGDSAGFPVTISQPGSYILTSNLEVPDANTTAISTNTSDVSLNLNGFSVRGPVTCTGIPATSCSDSGSGTGINAGARNRIHGGTVSGFGGTGVSTDAESRIWDLTVTHNAGNGINPYKTAVRNTTISFNGGHGITATAGGGNAEVSRSQIRGNGGYGADMSSGLVLDSRLLDNGQQGLNSSSGGGSAGYRGNLIQGNNGGGEQVSGGAAIGCNVIAYAAVCP